MRDEMDGYFSRLLLLSFVALLCWPMSAMAGDATLSWSPNNEPDLLGYKIYYGTTPGNYGPPISVTSGLSYTVTGLTDGQLYYFAVSAYDVFGDESAPSAEVAKQITAASTADSIGGGGCGRIEPFSGQGPTPPSLDYLLLAFVLFWFGKGRALLRRNRPEYFDSGFSATGGRVMGTRMSVAGQFVGGLILGIGLIISPMVAQAAPVLFYTDITSGPNVGGKDNKGAFVRIFGKGFGALRGTSTVTVGGGAVDNYPTWSDTEVSVQLGSNAATGSIILTTSLGASNGLPFTVRPGAIYFVDDTSPNTPGSGTYTDPWRSPASFISGSVTPAPGSILYFRAGSYTGQYIYSWPANFSFNANQGGTLGNPVSYLGYPGERPSFSGYPYVLNWHDSWKTTQHMVFANMEANGVKVVNNFDAGNLYGDEVGASNLRFVNWKVHDIPEIGATGIFKLSGDDNVVLGCEIYNNHAPSAKNLAHSFYPSNGLDNLEIGWNNMHDNDHTGYEISLHTDGIDINTVHTQNARIHDNIFTGNVRGIGIGRTGTASTYEIYNNLLYNITNNSAFMVSTGRANIYNNTTYNISASDIVSTNPTGQSPGIQGGAIRNNIFHSSGANYYPTTNDYINDFDVVEYNVYFGNGTVNKTKETHPINANPLFVNPSILNFRLQATSPAVNAGTSAVSSIVIRDMDGVNRTVGVYDIGAFEFLSVSNNGVPPNPPANVRVR